jgi:hypothetical protein
VRARTANDAHGVDRGGIRPGAEPVLRCLVRAKGLSAERPDRD